MPVYADGICSGVRARPVSAVITDANNSGGLWRRQFGRAMGQQAKQRSPQRPSAMVLPKAAGKIVQTISADDGTYRLQMVVYNVADPYSG